MSSSHNLIDTISAMDPNENTTAQAQAFDNAYKVDGDLQRADDMGRTALIHVVMKRNHIALSWLVNLAKRLQGDGFLSSYLNSWKSYLHLDHSFLDANEISVNATNLAVSYPHYSTQEENKNANFLETFANTFKIDFNSFETMRENVYSAAHAGNLVFLQKYIPQHIDNFFLSSSKYWLSNLIYAMLNSTDYQVLDYLIDLHAEHKFDFNDLLTSSNQVKFNSETLAHCLQHPKITFSNMTFLSIAITRKDIAIFNAIPNWQIKLKQLPEFNSLISFAKQIGFDEFVKAASVNNSEKNLNIEASIAGFNANNIFTPKKLNRSESSSEELKSSDAVSLKMS